MTVKHLMPALFIGHGSPMNAIEENGYASAWREAAAAIPRPKAILCISAHWKTEGLPLGSISMRSLRIG